MQKTFQKVGYNFIVSFLGKIGGIILSLFVIAFITRALGTGGFGEYSIILAFLYFFGVAADFGLYTFLIREISKKGSDEQSITSYVFTLRFFLAVVILALAPLIALLFPYSLFVKLGILIGALGFIFMSLSQILVAIFQKKLKMWVAAASEVLGRAAQLVLVILFVRGNLGLLSFVFAFVSGTFITFLFNFIFAKKLVKIKPAIDFECWKNVLKKSWPFALSIILSLIYFKIDTILLSVLKTPQDVGIYNAAYKILETTIVFPAILMGLFLPLLTASLQNMPRFKKIAKKAIQYIIVFALGAVVGGFVLAGPIIQVIAGSEFKESIQVLKILVFAIAIIFVGGYFGHLIVALNLQKKMNRAYLFCVFLNIIGNLIFIPKYSYLGAAYTTLVTEFLALLLASQIVYQKIKWLPKIKNFFKIILASLVMLLFLLLFQNLNYGAFGFLKLSFVIIAGAAVYFGFLIFLGAFRQKDISNFLINRAKK